MSGSQSLTPVTLEVVRHAIYAIAEEMSLIIMRSARSPLLKEAGDLSSALTDARGRLIAQGRDIPIHLGVMGFTVKEFLRRVPRRELRDGDVWYLNLPEVGGNHLPDVKAIRPVFAGGRLVAFAINLAHWADIGGAVPGLVRAVGGRGHPGGAPDRADQGVRPEGARRGPSTSSWRTSAAGRSARGTAGRCTPPSRSGPGASGSSSTATARPRSSAASTATGPSRRPPMRAAIREIPDGVYAGEDWVDDDGHEDRPVPVRVTVTVRGGRAAFDFTGTGPAVKGPVNATPYVTCSAVYYSVKSLVAPDVPANDGCYRPITVHIPPGTILNPPLSRAGRRRQSRDVPAGRGRVLQGAGPGHSRAHHRRRSHHGRACSSSAAARTGGGGSSTRSTGAGKAPAPRGTAATPCGSTCPTS